VRTIKDVPTPRLKVAKAWSNR